MNDLYVSHDYIAMNLRKAQNVDERRKMIESMSNILLSHIGEVLVDDVKQIHCENLVGAVSLPLGVAGPLKLKGQHHERDVLIPLATTEGALVASVSRGCKIISLAGGAVAQTEYIGPTRGPVFETKGIRESQAFIAFIRKHQDQLASCAEQTSSHLKLKEIETRRNGKYVYTRLIFDTDEAMGMNMVTIASDAVVSFLERHTEASCIAVAGNYDVDKKPAWLNFIKGRGRSCQAEVIIPQQLLKEHLKVSSRDLFKTVIAKCWGGSMMAGAMGYNAHFANIVAAFYAATGQDIAHVVEGSLGITSADVCENGDLYFSVYLPDIMLGTVGGGTKLKTQSEARSITGARNTEELAEVLTGAVLAGELSLLASITERTLGKAHKKLGR